MSTLENIRLIARTPLKIKQEVREKSGNFEISVVSGKHLVGCYILCVE